MIILVVMSISPLNSGSWSSFVCCHIHITSEQQIPIVLIFVMSVQPLNIWEPSSFILCGSLLLSRLCNLRAADHDHSCCHVHITSEQQVLVIFVCCHVHITSEQQNLGRTPLVMLIITSEQVRTTLFSPSWVITAMSVQPLSSESFTS